jgi:crossover junction endodeoxyribonuclease RuvC
MIKIFAGIDPGLVNTGIGIIEFNSKNNQIRYIESKTIVTSSKISIGERLCIINNEVEKIFSSCQIHYAGIEKTFLNSNPKTSMNLAVAKGIIMMNFAKFNILYEEIDANSIKKHISGYGHASKEMIKNSLKYYIKLNNLDQMSEHEIDAIAIAICAKFINESEILKNV